MINKVQASILSAGALVAALPGITSIQSGLATPPGYGPLFGGIQISLSAITILVIFLAKKKVKQSDKRAKAVIFGLLIAFFVSLTMYLSLMNQCVVYTGMSSAKDGGSDGKGTGDARLEGELRAHIFPIIATGTLAERIAATSRQQVATRYARGIDDLLQEQGFLVPLTVSLLLLLYVISMALLTAAFAIAGIQYSEEIVSE